MSADPAIESLLARGRLLRAHGRSEEAEQVFGEVLRLDPDNAWVHCQIALCRLMAKSREQDALAAVDHALSLDPEVAYFHAVRSMILHDLSRYSEAQAAADKAISFDPDEKTAHWARSRALFGLESWSQAEHSVRRALEIDPDFAPAHNLLSALLRVQNRRAENADQVRLMLERDPEDADAHANAGWAALQAGDREKAQTHFLEALRLEPDNEYARRGLLEAYKSRAMFYRRYLDYCMFMRRFTRSQRWAMLIGFLIACQFLRSLAALVGFFWALAVVAAYLLFALWSHLARSVGNAIVLADRIARHALRPQERLDGALGGLVLLGIGCGLGGLIMHRLTLAAVGVFLLALSIPFSKVLLNDSRWGRVIFGALSMLVVGAGLFHGLSVVVPEFISTARLATDIATGGVILSTYLGGVRALRERAS